MSKIGQKIINLPQNIKVTLEGNHLSVHGPKGELSLLVSTDLELKHTDQTLSVLRKKEDKTAKSLHGLFQKLISNMVQGVTEGFEKKLDFKGVGFKAEVKDEGLVLNVGYSHPVILEAPEGIEFKVEKNIITVSGIDKQKVGQVAADVRRVRPVEPYKGKGIKYLDEIPRRKPGKAAKAVVGAST